MRRKPNKVDLGNVINNSLIKQITKPSKDNNKAGSINTIKYDDAFNIFKYNKNKSQLNETIFEILPNIKLAIEVVVSSIISPNDMRKAVLTYDIDSDYIPTVLTTVVANKIKEYITSNYNLEDKLYHIIEESMFLKGSYAEMIIPSKFIRDNYKVITSLESHVDEISKYNLGFVNHIVDNDLNIEVTDNIDLLFSKERMEKSIEINNQSLIAGLEADMLSEIEEILSINPDDKPTDMPIIKKMDGDAVIPIASKDDPSRHYGYFILLDEKGNTISKNQYTVHSNILDLIQNNKQSQMDRVLSRVKSTLKTITTKEPSLSDIDKLKEVLIINKLKEATKSTSLDALLDTDRILKSEVLDLLLERILKNKKTKILYVPREILMYYAYEYRDNGTGRPLLEHVIILASLRVITLFSSLMALVRSNIPSTIVEATIDDNDPDVSRTMEKIKAEVVRNREFSLPIGLLKLEDITTWLHKTGYSFVFSGGNLPNTKIDVREETHDINPVNTELEDMIDKFIYNTFGLTPEQLNDAESANFATTIIASNRLFARRIDTYQRRYNMLITEHIRKILQQDGEIKNELKEILLSKDNIKAIRKFIKSTVNNKDKLNKINKMSDEVLFELLYKDILNNITIKLPEPVVTDTDTIAEMYKNFKDDLEDMIDAVITEDIFPEEMVEELSGKLETIKNIIKAVTLINWSKEHNYLPEVTELFNTGKDGKPVMMALEEYTSYVDMLQETILPFLKEMNTKKKGIAEALEKLESDDENQEDNDTEETNEKENNEENNKEEDNEETNTEEENSNESEEESNDENKGDDLDKDLDNFKV